MTRNITAVCFKKKEFSRNAASGRSFVETAHAPSRLKHQQSGPERKRSRSRAGLRRELIDGVAKRKSGLGTGLCNRQRGRGNGPIDSLTQIAPVGQRRGQGSIEGIAGADGIDRFDARSRNTPILGRNHFATVRSQRDHHGRRARRSQPVTIDLIKLVSASRSDAAHASASRLVAVWRDDAGR